MAKFFARLTQSRQSGRRAGALAGLLAIATTATPAAPGPAWAHQVPGFQSNGAVTVKSLGGGSFAGKTNPTGALAKANQTAVTQPPTVVIQATSSGNFPILMFTSNAYMGNLGGVVGADAKCQAEFGSGWRFAEAGKLVSGVPVTASVGYAWINNSTQSNSCNNWTTVTGNGTYLSPAGTPAYWSANAISVCNVVNRLACINF